MFSYYGSKSKIIQHYPPPKFNKIIEPFAGSARYALRFWQNDVLLVDKYSVITDVWNYLINATENDIKALPDEIIDLRELKLSEPEKLLISFCIGRGRSTPRNVPGGYNSWKQDKKRIISDLHKIKHWKIIQADYKDLENQKATWFIDPPYQCGGEYYKKSNKNIDFKKLAKWCKSRKGQSIVCENTKADWMDFKPMIEMRGSTHKTTEAIWSNYPTAFDNVQQTLFS